jgi:hypothetical protein
MNKLITVFALTMIIFGCSKKEATYEVREVNGIKITESSTTPADSTFKIVPKELYMISNDDENPDNCFMQASSLDLDEDGNLYVLDRKKFTVFKYDKSGKLVKIFGGHGQGPGEFINPGTVNARKDTIFVTDFQGFKVQKFNIDGDFIESKQCSDMVHFPYTPSKFGKNYITSGSSKNIASDDGKVKSIIETAFYDSSFNFIKNLSILEFEPPAADVEHDPSEKGIKAAASDINAYIYENSKTQYKIDIYDTGGNKVREIRKKYVRLKTPDDFVQQQKERNEKKGTKYKTEFRNSIYTLRADKYNRLWVANATDTKEDGNNYDIFENDIFVNRIRFNLEEDYTLNFVGDKIVGVNYSDNKIKIYEY